ncbi:hypothetical protein PFICI_01398 [Pestalotiopsis fici W106-1]|uniref:PWI domain-containing protein n=1 Tax=Pestalotiopsis fici (strain W106-1 / CGMCC3.15140) TaxID=1229662 RepID=W3XNN7_PESFW|nr:uncharacterized protein PFICI_01398 [Pestalotiopsis fici W106-1]ETS87570.1 hypothetical protein PFICI_01398 [Pestalotiopsis fici W106-1]
MAATVDQKLLRATKFPPEFNTKVDMQKVNLQVMKKWIAGKLAEILGTEDDVVTELCFNLIEGSRHPDIKSMQIQLTGFLEKETAPFCKEMWNLFLSAQSSPQGVPQELLEAKKLELIQEKLAAEKAAEEARVRRDQQERRNREMGDIRDRERRDRGFRGGRGDNWQEGLDAAGIDHPRVRAHLRDGVRTAAIVIDMFRRAAGPPTVVDPAHDLPQLIRITLEAAHAPAPVPVAMLVTVAADLVDPVALHVAEALRGDRPLAAGARRPQRDAGNRVLLADRRRPGGEVVSAAANPDHHRRHARVHAVQNLDVGRGKSSLIAAHQKTDMVASDGQAAQVAAEAGAGAEAEMDHPLGGDNIQIPLMHVTDQLMFRILKTEKIDPPDTTR